MTILQHSQPPRSTSPLIIKSALKNQAHEYNEERRAEEVNVEGNNPVISSAEFALKQTNLVEINENGVKAAASLIHKRLHRESYTPRTWRTHPLHILPPEPYSPSDPQTTTVLNWIFLISSLNFSFWSEREGCSDRFGIEWREGWRDEDAEKMTVHTGYWSLVAAIDRAMEEGIPITDPSFYASETACPDQLIEHIFRPAPQCSEGVPSLRERIAVLREVGSILTSKYEASFQRFVDEFQRAHDGQGTALQLVKKVTNTFPSFRDEVILDGRRVFIWKRAQILVAETWAAFYPPTPTPLPTLTSSHSHSHWSHPIFPNGAHIHELTMFADYRVPQILHHLRIIQYPPSLTKLLRNHVYFEPGSREEVSIRSASIVAVEQVRKEMMKLRVSDEEEGDDVVSSVLIDFYLWDLAKKVEGGGERVEDDEEDNGFETNDILPAHRTRSIWY
ncbi:Queuosine 5'-phosphate N-glycosylase/hydrolase [Abortiporus biennis]